MLTVFLLIMCLSVDETLLVISKNTLSIHVVNLTFVILGSFLWFRFEIYYLYALFGLWASQNRPLTAYAKFYVLSGFDLMVIL